MFYYINYQTHRSWLNTTDSYGRHSVSIFVSFKLLPPALERYKSRNIGPAIGSDVCYSIQLNNIMQSPSLLVNILISLT